MERTEKNGGICPDNVDAKGVIGGGREGVWWGGQYGWNHYQGYNIMYHGINIAVECAQLLTGDSGYLDFLRSQIKLQVDNGRKRGERAVARAGALRAGWLGVEPCAGAARKRRH